MESDWVLVDKGALRGTNIIVDDATGDVVSLSTRYCRDAERWRGQMPSLSEFSSSLVTLDLHKSRYLVRLDESVARLTKLRSLVLTSCDNLEELPDDLGRLHMLQEVRSLAKHKAV